MSSQSLSSLDSVPEDSQTMVRMSSASNRVRREDRRPSSLGKGKERMSQGSSSGDEPRPKAQWMVDLEKTVAEGETWVQHPRVILVLGGKFKTPETFIRTMVY